MDSLVKKNYISELRKIDWDFSRINATTGFSAFHWYPARYIPQVAGILINYFTDPGETVLDPFCGSGTTMIEAYKFGRKAVGIDLNPIGILMTKAKLTPLYENHFSSYSAYILNEARSIFLQLEDLPSDISKNAIPNYKMVKALKEHGIKTSEPRVRKIINHIRQLGIIRNLIASNKGYWVEIDEQERKKYVKGVKARAEAMLAALNHIDI